MRHFHYRISIAYGKQVTGIEDDRPLRVTVFLADP